MKRYIIRGISTQCFSKDSIYIASYDRVDKKCHYTIFIKDALILNTYWKARKILKQCERDTKKNKLNTKYDIVKVIYKI